MSMMVNPARFSAAATVKSFLLNGTTSTIEMGSAVVTAYPLTIVAWVKPDASLGSTSFFSVGSVGAGTARLDLVDNSSGAGVNHIDAQTVRANGTTVSASGPTNWTADVWQHVAAVFTSTTHRVAYFNGTAGTANTNADITPVGTFTKTNLGARYNAGSLGARLKGKLAYCAMWNIALTGAEISSLYGGALPTSVQPGNLVFYPVWSGSAVIDQISGATLTSTGVTADTDLPL